MNSRIGRSYVPFKHVEFWSELVKEHKTRYSYIVMLIAKGYVLNV